MRKAFIAIYMASALIASVASVMAQGGSDEAIRDYSRIIEANPDSAETWWLRGNAYWDKGDYERALADYNQTIAVDPNYALAYLGRGNVYLRKGDYDQALEEYDQVIEIQPEFIGTYNNRGVAYREKGQRDLAIQDLDFAIELKPDFAEAYYNRGLTYRDLGEHELALQDFKRAGELNPAFAKAVEEGGRAATDDKRGRAAALQDPKSVSTLRAESAKLGSKRGAVKTKEGDKGRGDRGVRRASKSQWKASETGVSRPMELPPLFYGLALGVAAIIVIALVRYRRRP